MLWDSIHADRFTPIDEIENSLHHELLKHWVLTFLANTHGSQIIFTTHDRDLLASNDVLRKDAVWFAEKQENGATEIYSLADFDLRKNLSFLNAYKAGKFGAQPNLGNIFIHKTNGEAVEK